MLWVAGYLAIGLLFEHLIMLAARWTNTSFPTPPLLPFLVLSLLWPAAIVYVLYERVNKDENR